jgi:hypothetical protein
MKPGLRSRVGWARSFFEAGVTVIATGYEKAGCTQGVSKYRTRRRGIRCTTATQEASICPLAPRTISTALISARECPLRRNRWQAGPVGLSVAESGRYAHTMVDALETPPDYSWLPPHQEHVAYTLAHVDQLIARVGELLWGYMQRDVFSFDNSPHPRGSAVTISHVQPFPEGIARVFADATTQLRAAIEHTIFAEVEHSLGRDLSPQEALTIEMPASLTEETFVSWLNHSKRRLIPALASGSPVSTRIRRLQPFHDVDPAVHPMRLLAEYTNFAKHRAPAITTVRVGPVMLDRDVPGVKVVEFDDPIPARVGDVLVHGPRSAAVGVSIYPLLLPGAPTRAPGTCS